MKISHLRNLYQKVGMFGTSHVGGPGTDQIRGAGFLHDGSIGTVDHFLSAPVFPQLLDQNGTPNQMRADVEQFMLAFRPFKF